MKSLRRLFLLLLCLLATACSPEDLLNPPRIATQTAQATRLEESASQVATLVPQAQIEPTATPTVGATSPAVAVVEPLMVWVNELSAEHRAIAQTIGENFADTSGIPIEFVFVAPDQIGELARAAQRNRRLPDLILHGIEATGGLLDAQILDVQIASSLADELGLASAGQALYPLPDGTVPALPSDGWQSMIFYRTDWLGSDFAAPNSYANIMSIAEAFDNIDDELELPEDVLPVAGFVAPTERGLVSTQRVFEWLALANGCHLSDEKGEVLLTQPVCIETLAYYYDLIFQFSPPDYQTDVTTIKSYIGGRSVMMVGTPHDLPILAGGDPAYPVNCAGCDGDYLLENTAFVLEIVGNNSADQPVNFAHANLLGITVGADPAAAAFAKFWFTDAMGDWLSVEPERKIPFYEPAVATWEALPMSNSTRSMSDLFPELAEEQRASLTTSERWGVSRGQGVLLSNVYGSELMIAPLVQHMLSGYNSIEGSAVDLRDAVITTIPLYQYFPTPEPTVEPDE